MFIKKYFFVFLFVFIIIASNELLAFENKYFKVDDTGWILVEDSPDKVTFDLRKEKNESDSDSETLVNVIVAYTELDEVTIPNYDDDDKNIIKDALEKNYFKPMLQRLKEVTRNHLMQQNRPRNEIDLAVNKVFSSACIYDCSISSIGGDKAFRVDMDLGVADVNTYVIVGYKCRYDIAIRKYKLDDVTSDKKIETFCNSFKMKAGKATQMNYLLHNFYKTKIFWVLVILLGSSLMKKLKNE